MRLPYWIQRIIRAIKGNQSSGPTGGTTTPTPTPTTTTPIEETLDTDDVNDGGPASPDWGYIYKHAEMGDHRKSEIMAVINTMKLNQERYEVVGQSKIPWWFIAFLHYRESSLNFNGVLHNGERIIGSGRKTKLVPKGRGPFISWEEAAIDALEMKGFYNLPTWSMAECCARAERYNGLGYRRTGEYSPYVCAGSTFHDETGKYVADGKYSSTAPEKQLGAIAIWKGLGL